jgi:hypothetical protein
MKEMKKIFFLLAVVVFAVTAHAGSPAVSEDLAPVLTQGTEVEQIQPADQLPLDPLMGAQPRSACRDRCKFQYLACLESYPYSVCSAQRTSCLAACGG